MQQFSSNKQREKVYIAIVLVGLIASLMLFAGLSSAVLVRKMDKFWVNINLPFAFKISTILILISSIFIYYAVKKAKNSDKKSTVYLLVLSLIFSLD
jgi:cytochrome c oxidase subunit 3